MWEGNFGFDKFLDDLDDKTVNEQVLVWFPEADKPKTTDVNVKRYKIKHK